MILALLTMGFSYTLSHPMLAHAWSGAFSSTPNSYPMLLMPALLRLHRNRKHYSGPFGSSWVGCTASRTAQKSNGIYKLALGQLVTIRDGKSFASWSVPLLKVMLWL